MDPKQLAALTALYESFAERHEAARRNYGRALTLAEKILVAHLDDPTSAPERGVTVANLRPDRVAMQDATAQMAILQFISAGKKRVAVPSTVHCDHLIRARVGSDEDLEVANDENREVYEFLRSASEKYGLGFWKPGAGIIHQVVLENYAAPGQLIIGTDSHTPNGGGLGMLAVGVGGADAVDAMVGMPWQVLWPKVIGIKLTGKLSGWTAPKDVILKLAGMLTVKGGTGAIIEYFGEGTESISCTGKATICNMGAELGATTSVFPFDESMARYLKATGREDFAALAGQHRDGLVADPQVHADPKAHYDRVVEINLSELEPHIVGPHTPDLARPISEMAAAVKDEGYPEQLSACLIGSCTNSSYEDIDRSSHIARQAAGKGIKAVSDYFVTPGSDQVEATIERDGQLGALSEIGGVVLANACGPCIGMWKREGIDTSEPNSILTSYNRNFPKRNDGSPATLAFIGSPEIVTAMALAGRLSFNPLTDPLTAEDGSEFMLTAPQGDELPTDGFVGGEAGFIAPAAEGGKLKIEVEDDSQRLQLLTPFEAFDGKDFTDLALLLKAQGKCTTDHISPAGPWLRFRGHLDNISNNMFNGANSAFGHEAGKGKNQLDGSVDEYSKIARAYKAAGQGWIAIGDENYGEGSSREHAAMEPRHLGAKAVLVRGFARIHETNLKKQGVLPLTFANAADYDKVLEDDRIDITGLADLAPGSTVTVVLHHQDGSEQSFAAGHTLTDEQIEWFRAGGALNLIRQQER
ncbi:aconitate hydratase [bacterium]|nr:MAG: aconitate hydratase [bacterium]RKZ16474.1 MAG: aconitate hydratase [bacterium]